MMASTYGERIASMEVEVKELKRAFHEFKDETRDELSKIDKKLDHLLEIRNKGAGIVWFISSILGSSGILAIFALLQYFRKG